MLYILNGPNLNRLGTREPEIYGHETLADIEARCRKAAGAISVRFEQSNHEGEIIDWIHEAADEAGAVLINPGALTHTSVGLMDAVASIDVPVIEVHLSQTAAREEFRHTSYVGKAAIGTIAGFGAHSYELAVQAALQLMKKAN